MANQAQARALRNYRKRLTEKGLARFEVLAPEADRELIREVARRLAENTPNAAETRRLLHRGISDEPVKKGGILKALRRSPLVGVDLDVARPAITNREIDL